MSTFKERLKNNTKRKIGKRTRASKIFTKGSAFKEISKIRNKYLDPQKPINIGNDLEKNTPLFIQCYTLGPNKGLFGPIVDHCEIEGSLFFYVNF